MTAKTQETPKLIGGKYAPLRELERTGNMTLSEVRGPRPRGWTGSSEGEPLWLAWFDISATEDRRNFLAYRDALRALRPAGLVELVSRADANYAVWRDVEGQSLDEFAELKIRRQDALDSLRLTATFLAEHGYALSDADVRMQGGTRAVIAYLEPAPRKSAAEIRRLNAPILRPLLSGRIRARPNYWAWLAPLPGVLMLTAAGWYSAAALQDYLNPPIGVVTDVTGMPANDAARKLSEAGFRVAYTEGEGTSIPIGSILRQEPDIGTNLPLGRLVTLTVNSPPDLTVPRIEDLTLERAEVNLKESGFRLGKVTEIDGTATQTPKGRIISQDPPAGLSTQRGQGVNVLVSNGIAGRETWLPDLTGLDFTSAREHARTAGLVVTEVVQEESDLPENTVIAQEPAPFVRVPGGDPVTLTVAAPKYAAPPTAVASLPVPPPYVPPTPARRAVRPPESGSNQSGLPSTGEGGQSSQGQTTPAPNTAPPAAVPAPQPTPESAAPPTTAPESAAPQPRTVALNYTFPADLPEGNYSIVVRDAGGQRVLMGATPAADLAGALASNNSVQVTGEATFFILRDGQVFATSQPQ